MVAPSNASTAPPTRPVVITAAIVITFALVLALTAEPISQNDSHAGRMWLALVTMALAGWRVFARSAVASRVLARQKNRLQWVTGVLLALTCIYGVGNYYQFDAKKVTQLHSYEDTTYYYVNSKYFDELSYFSLYPAMLMADEEQPARRQLLNDVRRYRDLHTYRLRGRTLSDDERAEIRGAFSNERWRAFKHDVQHLVSRWPGGKAYFFSDHGYNPPPTWTIVGGTLSSAVPVEHVWLLAKIDLILVVMLLGLIARTYGRETFAFALLFFVTTYSGRWPMLGDSILRFDWLVALVAGTCFLRRKHMLAAGACLAYAALNRVFPAIFLFPVAAAFAVQIRRDRRVSPEPIQFVTGAAVATVCLVGGALWAYGIDAFIASKDNLLLHQSSASFSRYRIGFAAALGFRAEHTGSALAAAGGIAAKASVVDELGWLIKSIAIAILLIIAWWAERSRWSADRLLPLAIAPLFVLTNPQINYFNLRLLLVCWHLLDLNRARNRFGLIALFGIEAMTQYSHVVGNDRYATMAYTSVGLCAYLATIYASLLLEAKWPELGVRWANRFAVGAMGIVALVYASYWRAGLQVNPAYVDADSLAEIRNSGTRWNARGTVRILAGQTLIVNLDRQRTASTIDISFDNNDRYELRFFDQGTEVSRLTAERTERGPAKGLWRESYDMPPDARDRAFDRIHVTAQGGDGAYSIGHLIIGD